MKIKRTIATLIAMNMAFQAIPTFAQDNSDDITVYIAGDSTACVYGEDENYALPRAGWGMYLEDYLYTEKNKQLTHIEVKDLAKSGRSSKSFVVEDEYRQIFDNIESGNYLLIQFGHNDAKNTKPEDIELRYTKAEGDKDTEGSFKNSLYVNYIKPALDKGAKPILLTPIARRQFDENGRVKDTHGLYDDAVRELAQELNLPCLDLTKETELEYNVWGAETAKKYHAIFKDGTKGENGIDNTHLNHYGAKVVARLVAKELSEKDSDGLGQFVAGVGMNPPSDKVTRGDFTARLVRVLGIEAEAKDCFKDVDSSDKNYNAIAVAKAAGLANGNENGNFMPNENITEQDMAVITARALEKMGAVNMDNTKTEPVYGASEYALKALYTLDAVDMLDVESLMNPSQFYIDDGYAMSIMVDVYEAKLKVNEVSSQGEMSIDELEKVE